MQFNIPPGKVCAIHFVTCEYRAAKPHRQGFRPEDWEIATRKDGEKPADADKLRD